MLLSLIPVPTVNSNALPSGVKNHASADVSIRQQRLFESAPIQRPPEHTVLAIAKAAIRQVHGDFTAAISANVISVVQMLNGDSCFQRLSVRYFAANLRRE